MTSSIRVVMISEDIRERQQLARWLEGLPKVEVVAEVNLISQMGKQAGNTHADCVVLDIDRYPLAGALGLAQARATFPEARIVVLARAIHPRFRQFLRESGASCCLDKDDPDKPAQLINACWPFSLLVQNPVT